MKKKQKPGRETRQKMAFSAVLGIALLFLGGVLAVNFWQHLSGSDVFATVISGLGTLLFLAVGIILLSDLIRQKSPGQGAAPQPTQKEEDERGESEL